MGNKQSNRSRKRPFTFSGYNGRPDSGHGTVFIFFVVCSFLSAATCVAQGNAAPQAVDAESFLAQGQTLATADRLAEAEAKLEEAVKVDPSNLHAITLLAKVKARLGESKEAVELFRRVVLADSGSSTAHLDLAIALADSGETAASLEELRRSISLDPKSAQAHLNLARILSDSREVVAAGGEFKKAAALAPDDPDVYLYWAMSEKDNHRSVQAIPLFKRALQLQPDNALALFSLGNCLHELGRDTEAVAAWRRAVAINPMFEQALYALSQALRTNSPSQSAEFLKRFEEVRSSKQNNVQATQLGNKAFAAMQRQDWQAAIESLREAIQVCNQCAINAALHQRLGLAECHQGDLEAGETELRRALELNPNDRTTVTALEWVSKQKQSLSPNR